MLKSVQDHLSLNSRSIERGEPVAGGRGPISANCRFSSELRIVKSKGRCTTDRIFSASNQFDMLKHFVALRNTWGIGVAETLYIDRVGSPSNGPGAVTKAEGRTSAPVPAAASCFSRASAALRDHNIYQSARNSKSVQIV
jgi:hypothetical protein